MTCMGASCATPAFDFALYKSLENTELTERIQRVRTQMGGRLLILGHHYQQDEVIALADLRGDSYQLAALASSHDECRAIAFCGVHFMAETADILANRPERLEAQRAGERVASRFCPTSRLAARWPIWPTLIRSRNAGISLAGVIDVGDRDAHHVCQLGGELEGVLRQARRHRLHVVQCPGRAWIGPSSGARAVYSSSPTSTWAATRPKRHGRSPWTQMPMWSPGAARILAATTAEAIRNGRVLLWRGLLLRAPEIFRPQGYRARLRAECPGIRDHRASGMYAWKSSMLADDRRLDRQDHSKADPNEATPGT